MVRGIGISRAGICALLVALLVAGPALANGSGHGGNGNAPGRAFLTLTVLHNNDGESALLAREVAEQDGSTSLYGGISNFAGLVWLERLKGNFCYFFVSNPGRRCASLLLNSGDNFLAGTTFEASRAEGAPFYDAEAVRALRYDALAIGNHEFDFGPATFAEFVREVGRRNRFVSANLDYSGEPELQALANKRRLRDRIILYRRGMLIGVFGLTTPTLPTISSPGGVVASSELVAIAQAEVDALRRRGARVIIMQSHLQGIAIETDLVSQVEGIDLVIAGGGGELLANADDALVPGDAASGDYPRIVTDLAGTDVPIVTTSGNYEYLGKLVANFDRAGNLLEVLDESGPVVVRQGDVPRVQKLVDTIEAPVQAFVDGLAANVLATSEVVLDCERPEVRGGESNCGNLMADSMLAAATAQAPLFGVPVPDVAFQNGGGIRGEIDQAAGDFTEADTFRLAPFSNFVSIAEDVPAETFRQLLEEGAVRIGTGFDGGFVQAAGFSYTIDPSRAARVTDDAGNQVSPGDRITEVTLDDGTIVVSGGVATPGLTLTVASNDFSLNGGDAYPALPFTRVGVSYQQALSDFVSGLGTITAADYPRGGEGRITILP